MKTKIYVNYVDYERTIEFAIIREDEVDGKRFIAKPVKLEFEEMTAKNYPHQPTFRMFAELGKEFMRAMAEALDKEGIKTDKDAKIQGTLEATRYHLEDLRALLELPRETK